MCYRLTQKRDNAQFSHWGRYQTSDRNLDSCMAVWRSPTDIAGFRDKLNELQHRASQNPRSLALYDYFFYLCDLANPVLDSGIPKDFAYSELYIHCLVTKRI